MAYCVHNPAHFRSPRLLVDGSGSCTSGPMIANLPLYWGYLVFPESKLMLATGFSLWSEVCPSKASIPVLGSFGYFALYTCGLTLYPCGDEVLANYRAAGAIWVHCQV